MSVLLFAENSEGSFRKAVFEAATYGYDLAQKMGTALHAVSVGPVDEAELKKLGQYGVAQVHRVADEKLDSFVNSAYAAAVTAVAKSTEAQVVVLPETYNGRAIAPRIAVKLDAAALPSLI